MNPSHFKHHVFFCTNQRDDGAQCCGDAGPVLVVYPEAVWYTYVDEADIDEIFEVHLKQGRIVERLMLK